MVRRWNCRHCDFSVWGAVESAVTDRIKSHIVSHHRNNISQDNFQLEWECPYCESSSVTHETDEGVREFKDHLYSHVEPLIEAEVHVADEIDGSGNVLVLSPLTSPGADNARIHFISPCDIAIFVTDTPAARVELLDEHLQEWPAWTILISTVDDPLAGVSGIDLSSIPLEIVHLDGALGLSGLGETLSRVVGEQESATGKITVEFDILPEIVAKFDLQQVFKFCHVVTSRLDDASALSHYYLNPGVVSQSTVNMFRQLFDLTIEVEDTIFTTPR